MMGILYDDETLERMAKEALAQGRIMEAAWMGCRAMMVPANATEKQVAGARTLFFTGAKTLLSVLQYTTDVEDRMEKLEAELAQWDAFMREKGSGTKQ
jgi:hypothetical protein